jgi:tripartite-type tricarboxylate transporter receptor subunit TctC
LVAQEPDKAAVARFLSLTTALSRPLAAPPAVPQERLANLRAAFEATMRDADFLAEAQRMAIDIDPMSASQMQAAVREVLATPQVVIRRTQAAMDVSGR